MQLVLLGLNHKTAPVEVREAFSFTPEEQNNALEFLYNYPGIIECVVLSTCNRMEIYALVKQCQDPHDLIFKALCQIRSIAAGHEEAFYCKTDRACVDHLFHVSSGLDSLVVGEGQILSQLKAAYLRAYQGGYTETVFNILFQRAIRIGKLVRTRTAIADTPVSVSYTAVNLAEEVLNKPMNQAKALILGAGTMSELTATYDRTTEIMGDRVFYRGLIELSNICTDNCRYCGIRKDSHAVKRYEMTKEEILSQAKWAADHGYGSICLQAGERRDPKFVNFIAECLRDIHKLSVSPQLPEGLGVTISLGDQTKETYELWAEASGNRKNLRGMSF